MTLITTLADASSTGCINLLKMLCKVAVHMLAISINYERGSIQLCLYVQATMQKDNRSLCRLGNIGQSKSANLGHLQHQLLLPGCSQHLLPCVMMISVLHSALSSGRWRDWHRKPQRLHHIASAAGQAWLEHPAGLDVPSCA